MPSEPKPSSETPATKKRPLKERLSSEHYLAMLAELHDLEQKKLPMSKALVDEINRLQRKYEALARPEPVPEPQPDVEQRGRSLGPNAVNRPYTASAGLRRLIDEGKV